MTVAPILPYPQSVMPGSGHCDVQRLEVRVADAALEPAAQLLQEALQSQGSEQATAILNLSLDSDISHPEGYRLSIAEKTMDLRASTPAGAFYGIQSLLQLASSGKPVSAMTIDDQPAYAWRGMHLDCSRHFFGVPFIKRYIDLLARHKMNRFHWHLCDDQGWRLESKRFPELTRIGGWRERSVTGHTANRERQYEETRYGGFYSRQEVAEVVAYAAQRHIEVLPEIDIPGHAAALLAAYPHLSCDGGNYRVEEHYGIFPDVLCPSEETFSFLAELFAEVAELFPFEYVHIGGDEVIKDQWRACARCQQLMHEKGMGSVDQLHGYFVTRVEAILAKLERRAIGWDEVMDGDIDTATTIMCWTGFDACRRALKAGHQTIMTPVECTYFDFYQSTSLDEPRAIHGLATLKQVFDYDPLPAGVPESLRPQILGAQANVWTEYLREPGAVEYACLPRMSALAEVTWTGTARNWEQFCQRLPLLMAQLESEGHRVARSVYKPIIEVSATDEPALRVTLGCDMPGLEIHYTADGSTPTIRSPRYTAPLRIAQNCVLRCRSVDPATGEVFGEERQHLQLHKALHRPLFRVVDGQLAAAPDLSRLTNGRLGRERIFHGFEWTQFDGTENDIAVDLGAITPIQSVQLNFEAGAHRLLFFPSAVDILVSEDGSEWVPVCRSEAGEFDNGALFIAGEIPPARFVRLRIENDDQHYGPEQRRNITRPVHLDELVIN